jgi:hypothetical protein
MQLMMSLSGLSLAVLGSFAVYAFWLRKAKRARRRTRVPHYRRA